MSLPFTVSCSFADSNGEQGEQPIRKGTGELLACVWKSDSLQRRRRKVRLSVYLRRITSELCVHVVDNDPLGVIARLQCEGVVVCFI